MKPERLYINTSEMQSFSVRRDMVPHMNNRWHYHSELELIYFKKGYGTQFVGDNVRSFKAGEVVLVGSNLPHYWQFDHACFGNKNNVSADVYVVHFDELFLGTEFLNLPENEFLKVIFIKAKNGIQFTGDTAFAIGLLIERLFNIEYSKKIILLLEAFFLLSKTPCRLLSSIGFNPKNERQENERIHHIYDFTIANFKRKISIREIASISNISAHAFCRYFKSKTGKTYIRFLNEIRVGHACKLLIENKKNIKLIMHECGFCNFASFYKQFKSITAKSPTTYRNDFYGVKNSGRLQQPNA